MSDTLNENQLILDEARATVEHHLAQCCQELLAQKETCVLCDGIVRLVAGQVGKIDARSKFSIAEAMIREAAMRRVVEMSKEIDSSIADDHEAIPARPKP